MDARATSEQIRSAVTGRANGGPDGAWAHAGRKPARLNRPRQSRPLPHPEFDRLGADAYAATVVEGWERLGSRFDASDSRLLLIGLRVDGRVVVWEHHGPRRKGQPYPGHRVLWEGKSSERAVVHANRRLRMPIGIHRTRTELDLAEVRAELRVLRAAMRDSGLLDTQPPARERKTKPTSAGQAKKQLTPTGSRG